MEPTSSFRTKSSLLEETVALCDRTPLDATSPPGVKDFARGPGAVQHSDTMYHRERGFWGDSEANSANSAIGGNFGGFTWQGGKATSPPATWDEEFPKPELVKGRTKRRFSSESENTEVSFLEKGPTRKEK